MHLKNINQFTDENNRKKRCCRQVMGKERDFDNDGLNLSEEYFRKNKNDNIIYFPPEESEPPHYV